MHGKIVQYSHSNGNGIIINASKKLFDFKTSAWHDATKIPEIGLLVEFRLEDEGGSNNVIDVRSSKYQEFDEGSIIKEKDFWKTNSDSDLEKLESNIFDEIIAQTYKSTDYTKLNNIATSISIAKFTEYHFENETKIIKIAYKLPINNKEKLDYRIVNKFIKRTLDSLIYTDKRITKDTFSMYLQIISKLEYFTTPFYKAEQNTNRIFEEAFLAHQLYYNAAKRKLSNTKEDLLKVENKKRNLKSEIYNLNLKLNSENTKNKQEIKARIDKLQAQYVESEKELKILILIEDKIQKAISIFIKTYKDEFIKHFEKIRTQIFEYIINALNIAITALDNKIWQLGMNSEPIKNHFFKTPTGSYAFCSLAFMQQYIKTLDPSKLNDNDRILSNYINRYKDRNTKRVLVVSSKSDLETELKIDILKKYKDYFVLSINKKMEYLIVVQNQKFDFIIIDNNMKEDKPIEMIMSGKNTKYNKNAVFILYQPPKK